MEERLYGDSVHLELEGREERVEENDDNFIEELVGIVESGDDEVEGDGGDAEFVEGDESQCDGGAIPADADEAWVHDDANLSDDPDWNPCYASEDIDDIGELNIGDEDDLTVEQRRVIRGPIFDPELDAKDVVMQVGLQFTSMKEFRMAMKNYCIYNGLVDTKYTHNDAKRCQMKCSENCQFRVWCSKITGEETYQIKTWIGHHDCTRSFKNKKATAKWLSKKIVNLVRANPTMGNTQVIGWVMENLSLDITGHQAYHARKYAKEIVEGVSTYQFGRLRDYCMELRRTNMGTSCIVRVCRTIEKSPAVFSGVYVCLEALKKGFFYGCRPFFGIDGCFLKGIHGGQLLTAVGQDGNGGLFPIAWAVVQKENGNTWKWFLERLFEDLGGANCREWTIISDRQKGIVQAIEKNFEGVEHRFCVRHMYNNFSQIHKGLQLQKQFYACARAKTTQQLDNEMLKMKELNMAAWEWLARIPPCQWSKAAFKTTSKNASILNNICESYNGKILKYRDKPVISLLEELRKDAMRRMVKLRLRMIKHDKDVVPLIDKLVENNRQESRFWVPVWAGDSNHALFEVGRPPEQYVVDLKEKTCSCRAWDLTGVPCPHAIAAISKRGHKYMDYISHYYLKETYIRTYSQVVFPVNGEELWPKLDCEVLLPPPFTKTAGRPKLKRRRQENESSTTSKLRRSYPIIRCTKCGGTGHNKRGCKGLPAGEHSQVTTINTTEAEGGLRGRGRGRGRGRNAQPQIGVSMETMGVANSSIIISTIIQASQESDANMHQNV